MYAIRSYYANLHQRTSPLVVEIQDSATYRLDLGLVSGTENSGGRLSLRPAHSLTIRAATGQRPVIRLVRPLRFRPVITSYSIHYTKLYDPVAGHHFVAGSGQAIQYIPAGNSSAP